MRLSDRTVLFFIAGTVPTADELALILRTEGIVKVRSLNASPLYGAKLEPAYALAGSIPDSYKTGEGATIDTALYPGGDVTPGPVGATVTLTDGETVTVAAITGGHTHATFTIVDGVITAIALT